MTGRKPRYSREEFAERGAALYEARVRAGVEPGQAGRIVAIDIESGEFAVGDSVLEACRPLIERNGDSQIWTMRVGDRAVHRIGAWHGGRSRA